MRLTKAEFAALVRFEAAGRMGGNRPIDDAFARLYYLVDRNRPVPADVVRSLLDKGALALPAAGQYRVTSVGRKALERAIKKG